MRVVTGWVIAMPSDESRRWGLAAAVALATQPHGQAVRYEGHAALWANRYRWTEERVELVKPREAS